MTKTLGKNGHGWLQRLKTEKRGDVATCIIGELSTMVLSWVHQGNIQKNKKKVYIYKYICPIPTNISNSKSVIIPR